MSRSIFAIKVRLLMAAAIAFFLLAAVAMGTTAGEGRMLLRKCPTFDGMHARPARPALSSTDGCLRMGLRIFFTDAIAICPTNRYSVFHTRPLA